MISRFALALTFSAFIPAALADSCDTATSQAELNSCAEYSFKQADTELNDAYKELLAGYKTHDVLIQQDLPEAEPVAPALIATQRAWIILRDTECHLEGLATQGGSALPMIVSQCKDRLTRERVTWLRMKFTCREGDLACIQLGDAAD